MQTSWLVPRRAPEIASVCALVALKPPRLPRMYHACVFIRIESVREKEATRRAERMQRRRPIALLQRTFKHLIEAVLMLLVEGLDALELDPQVKGVEGLEELDVKLGRLARARAQMLLRARLEARLDLSLQLRVGLRNRYPARQRARGQSSRKMEASERRSLRHVSAQDACANPQRAPAADLTHTRCLAAPHLPPLPPSRLPRNVRSAVPRRPLQQ